MQKRDNLLPYLMLFSLSLFTLLLLGVWQLNKNYLKKNNQISFSKNLEKKPINILDLNRNFQNFQFIKAEGKFLNELTLFFEPRTFKGIRGYHKMVPFKVKSKIVMVNRGFVEKKEYSRKEEEKSIQGIIIKFPKPKYYELENDRKSNKWYTLDKDDVSEFMGLELVNYILYEVSERTNKKTKNVLPNTISRINHLQYAITWFLLAMTMCTIFIIKLNKYYK